MQNKKNKNKNNGNNKSNKTLQGFSKEQPIKVEKVIKENLSTEEAKKRFEEELEIIEKYRIEKEEEINKYTEEQKKKADLLEEKKTEDIKKEIEKALKDKEKHFKEIIENAKTEAEAIRQDARKKADNEIKKIEDIQKKLDEKSLVLAKELAKIESSKVVYKQEVLDDIKNEINIINEEKNKLEEQIEKIRKELKKKISEVIALEEDKNYYEIELSKNSIKKSEINSYKSQIVDLQNDYIELEKLYKEQREKLRLLKSQILLYGEDPQKAMKDNLKLNKKINELESLIAGCPSAEELQKLRETSAKFEALKNKLDILNAEKLRLEVENNDLKVSIDEIESLRRFVKILELQKAELQKELERNIELYSMNSEKVFSSLSLIDKEINNEYPKFSIRLKELCDKFRGYLANRSQNPLYYDEMTIRTFIAGFASSRIMILEGLSGTGKSSLPRAFADFMGSKTIEVPVQSSWKDRNDLLGFYNDFKKQYKETEFLKALYRATHDQNNIYIIVLDEMNLSRIEYYFADLLSVLEKPNVEDWKIELISDYASIAAKSSDAWPKLIHEGKLQIGDNTWFVGTANKDDSTFVITDKVYDRSVILNFDKKGEKEKIENSNPIKMNNDDFQLLLRAASRNKIDEVKFKEMIKYLDTQIKDNFEITFGNRIANQLEIFVPVYVECGGTIDEAVDIMFSKKILRKLEGIYDEDTKLKLEVLKEDINKKYKMPLSIKTIDRMIEKI